jgi:hypothetical protein
VQLAVQGLGWSEERLEACRRSESRQFQVRVTRVQAFQASGRTYPSPHS